MLPFGQKEGNEMATLFAIGAGEEDDVVRKVNSHDGGESWTVGLVKRWSKTVKGDSTRGKKMRT